MFCLLTVADVGFSLSTACSILKKKKKKKETQHQQEFSIVGSLIFKILVLVEDSYTEMLRNFYELVLGF